MKKILITGGLGFVGSNLILFLKDKIDAEIIIYDNDTNPSKTAVLNDCRIINADIRDKDKLSKSLAGIDCVIHLAAHTRVMDSIEDPQLNFDINTIGTFNILEAMRQNEVPLIVNASTGGAILGDVQPPVDENMVPNPISPYGASKLAAEAYLSAYSGSYGVKAISLRFSNLYGKHSLYKGSVVAAFIKDIRKNKAINIYGDGTQTRDFLFVDDLSLGIYQAISKQKSGVFQLGSGIGTSVNEIVEIISDLYEPETFTVNYLPARQGEILHNYCNINKAKSTFGYNPQVDLTTGIKQTKDWFEAVS